MAVTANGRYECWWTSGAVVQTIFWTNGADFATAYANAVLAMAILAPPPAVNVITQLKYHGVIYKD